MNWELIERVEEGGSGAFVPLDNIRPMKNHGGEPKIPQLKFPEGFFLPYYCVPTEGRETKNHKSKQQKKIKLINLETSN